MTSDEILLEIELETGVLVSEIKGRDRSATVSEARHMATWFLCEYMTSWGHRRVGKCLGGRDRSTVYGSVKMFESLYESDLVYRGAADRIDAKLKPRAADRGEGSCFAIAPPAQEISITVNVA